MNKLPFINNVWIEMLWKFPVSVGYKQAKFINFQDNRKLERIYVSRSLINIHPNNFVWKGQV